MIGRRYDNNPWPEGFAPKNVEQGLAASLQAVAERVIDVAVDRTLRLAIGALSIASAILGDKRPN